MKDPVSTDQLPVETPAETEEAAPVVELPSPVDEDVQALSELPFDDLQAPVAPHPVAVIPRAVRPRPVPANASLDDPTLFFNQELSWIDFNWRVLWQAMDDRYPLLERVRFLAITASNLDEFFQKRVGGLKRQQAAHVHRLTPDGRTPEEQLSLILEAAALMHPVAPDPSAARPAPRSSAVRSARPAACAA